METIKETARNAYDSLLGKVALLGLAFGAVPVYFLSVVAENLSR